METYLRSIRGSALAILDAGRVWDGGLFQLIGENNILYNAVANKTFNRQLITADIKSTILSGGTLVALVLTILLILTLLAVIVVSICCRCRPPSEKYLVGKKLQSRFNRVNKQLLIPLRPLFGILCAIVLVLALVPLVLAFATNSRLHASVSDTQASVPGTVANQIGMVFSHMDTFLARLIPEARVDVRPVVQRTLEMSGEMKVKSQSAYQQEFREVIGANELTDASSDLLDRIGLYYYSGKRLKDVNEGINSALNDLKRTNLHSYEEVCMRSLDPSSAHICRNHTALAALALEYIALVRSNWTDARPSDSKNVQEEVRNVTDFLGNLVGALDATGNTPVQQNEMKEQKLKVSQEFNQNISQVFDQELNSTAFVLNGVEEKFAELEDKIQSARDGLQNMSARVHAAYGSASSKFESIRFGATTVLCVLLLATLVSLTTAAVIILLVPDAARSRSRSLVSIVFASYAAYAAALLFVCLLFCVTSYLQTETCRYMYEAKTADKFLVPQVNAVISELKAQAASDPNRADAIPLKGIGRLVGGLLEGCHANRPILVALDAVNYIDTEVSNSGEQSLKFKEKGRDILRREMNRVNLEVLRDSTMEEKMKNLRIIFKRYGEFNFSSVGMHLAGQRATLEHTQQLLLSLTELNNYIDTRLPPSEDSTTKLSLSNRLNIQASLDAVQTLLNITRSYTPEMQTLETRKTIVLVIDRVIASSKVMETYLANRTAWTETAVEYYTKHVIEGSANESKAIADATTIGFLSTIAKCGEVYSLYQTLAGIPCQSLLYPLSILWFCLAWFLWFAVLLSMLVHLSLTYFVDRSDQPPQQQQQPLDDSMPLSKRTIFVSSQQDTGATHDEPISLNPLMGRA